MLSFCFSFKVNVFEKNLLKDINQYRESLHLPKICVVKSLSKAADSRIKKVTKVNAKEMSKYEWMPLLKKVKYKSKKYAAISGSRKYPQPPSIVTAIKSSAADKAILEGQYNCIGIGKKRIGRKEYFSLLFGECDEFDCILPKGPEIRLYEVVKNEII